MGLDILNSNNYQTQIKKGESNAYYIKLRNDAKRTFLTSKEYHSRVSEQRIVRLLNSFIQQYEKPYCQGMDAIAAVYAQYIYILSF